MEVFSTWHMVMVLVLKIVNFKSYALFFITRYVNAFLQQYIRDGACHSDWNGPATAG